jgi:hypothetical protein
VMNQVIVHYIVIRTVTPRFAGFFEKGQKCVKI